MLKGPRYVSSLTTPARGVEIESALGGFQPPDRDQLEKESLTS